MFCAPFKITNANQRVLGGLGQFQFVVLALRWALLLWIGFGFLRNNDLVLEQLKVLDAEAGDFADEGNVKTPGQHLSGDGQSTPRFALGLTLPVGGGGGDTPDEGPQVVDRGVDADDVVE